jgi:hypothetical protein
MSFYIRSTLFLFLLFSISACGVNHLVYNKERFNPEEKAVVFFYVTEQNVPLHFNIKKFGSKGNISIFNQELDTYQIFTKKPKERDLVKKHIVLEPGLYYIDKITLLTEGNLNRWYPSPGLTENLIVYGAFRVKEGEVLSLGRLDVTGSEFKHYDNFNALKEQLKGSDISELSDRLKTKGFYNRGSLLIKSDKSKVIRIVSSETVEHQRKKIIQEITRRLESQSQ